MMKASMKRYAPYAACLLGLVVLVLLLPRYRVAQPATVSITRGQALAAADVQARKLGIPTDKAWTSTIWMGSPLLEDELKGDPARLERARRDPAIGPRMGGYRVTYYRRGLDKFLPYGMVYVGGSGEILAARMRKRSESVGAKMTEAQLRPRADAFVASRTFPGAPSPHFESARPSVLTKRTDWVFRYRVNPTSPIGNIVPYLNVYFVGDQFAGWELIEEYADGRQYSGDNTGQFVSSLARFGTMFLVLLGLLFIFLKKYHAGEVGVGTSTLLFILALVLLVSFDILIGASAAEGTGMGSLDAQATMFGMMAFKLLLADLPLAILIFFGWSVGESYARERWGERLASFDALLRRDPFNATVGRSVLIGLLCAPAVAAAAFLVGLIPLFTGLAHVALGAGTELVLFLSGPLSVLVTSATDALLYSVVAILFVLAFAHRRRALWMGAVAVLLLGALGGLCEVPIDPSLPRFLFGFGGTLACIAIFLAFDLLSTAVAIFAGSLLTLSLPLLPSTSGLMRQELLLTMAGPVIVLAGFAVAALLTRREVVYTYEDLAPHVKRIVERERVKAEIDAANRIQAALLPLGGLALPRRHRDRRRLLRLPHPAQRRDRHRLRGRLRPRPHQRHRHGHGQGRAPGAGGPRRIATRRPGRAQRHRHEDRSEADAHDLLLRPARSRGADFAVLLRRPSRPLRLPRRHAAAGSALLLGLPAGGEAPRHIPRAPGGVRERRPPHPLQRRLDRSARRRRRAVRVRALRKDAPRARPRIGGGDQESAAYRRPQVHP
jgi:hypothetical protein